MATTTTNFGWDIPQSTDLVKDGATAIAALGQDIDTALIDLKGGTTGQILSKASATDLDYTWITNDVGDITGVTAGTGISGGGTSGAVTVTNSMATEIDAKGDLIIGTGSDTFSRLAVGTNNFVLTADSTETTGVKWAAVAAGGGKILQVVAGYTTTLTNNSTTTFADTTLSATITPTSATSTILVLVSQNGCNKSVDNANNALTLRLLRASTTLITFTGTTFLYTGTTVRNNATASVAYIDSPATTSATTYKTQLANRNASASVGVQNDSETSSMILLEIGA
jgi:hypothetical protein